MLTIFCQASPFKSIVYWTNTCRNKDYVVQTRLLPITNVGQLGAIVY